MNAEEDRTSQLPAPLPEPECTDAQAWLDWAWTFA